VVFALENKSKKYVDLLRKNIKSKTKNAKVTVIVNNNVNDLRGNINQRLPDAGVRVCIIDDDDAVIFPISEEDVHPDYDLGIWIKNNQASRFLRSLLGRV